MKNKLKKYKRPPVDWCQCLRDCKNRDISAAYYLFIQAHPGMSLNRCAYNVLKKYYSTTALAEYRKNHVPLMDVDMKDSL